MNIGNWVTVLKSNKKKLMPSLFKNLNYKLQLNKLVQTRVNCNCTVKTIYQRLVLQAC